MTEVKQQMDVQKALKSQYHAALLMLRETIELCPADLWTAGEARPFWRIAYHALYYTHLYLQPDEAAFQPWDKHRPECHFLQWGPEEEPNAYSAYTQAEMLDYWRLCDRMIDAGVDRLDLEAPECGFSWYSMPKLEHQMMNIRHLQQHTGQLAELLNQAEVDTSWIGKASFDTENQQ